MRVKYEKSNLMVFGTCDLAESDEPWKKKIEINLKRFPLAMTTSLLKGDSFCFYQHFSQISAGKQPEKGFGKLVKTFNNCFSVSQLTFSEPLRQIRTRLCESITVIADDESL
jgi:hypothetical protein